MLLTTPAPAYIVSGTFSGGSITEDAPYATGCAKQIYSVNGQLEDVTKTNTGAFVVKLTHYRKRAFGRCWTYAATVAGTVTLG